MTRNPAHENLLRMYLELVGFEDGGSLRIASDEGERVA